MKNETKKNIIDKAAELLLNCLNSVDDTANDWDSCAKASYLSEVIKNISETRTDEEKEELDRAFEESKKRIAEITNRARERNKDQAVITCTNNTQH